MFVRFVCCLACGLSLTSNIYYIEHPCVARVTAPWSSQGRIFDMVPKGESLGMLYLLSVTWCSPNEILGKHPQLLHGARLQAAEAVEQQAAQPLRVVDFYVAAAQSDHPDRPQCDFGAAATRADRGLAGQQVPGALAVRHDCTAPPPPHNLILFRAASFRPLNTISGLGSATSYRYRCQKFEPERASTTAVCQCTTDLCFSALSSPCDISAPPPWIFIIFGCPDASF